MVAFAIQVLQDYENVFVGRVAAFQADATFVPGCLSVSVAKAPMGE